MTDQTCQSPNRSDSDGDENATVLVVDDDLVILEALADLLGLSGYSVLTATDGIAALQTMESQAPDVIVADVTMPGMDGHAFRETVHLNHEWVMIPFIFLTARRDPSGPLRGTCLGDDGYMTKPFEPDDLLVAIEAQLKRVRGIRAATPSDVRRTKRQ